jgi:hypothetical protein
MNEIIGEIIFFVAGYLESVCGISVRNVKLLMASCEVVAGFESVRIAEKRRTR